MRGSKSFLRTPGGSGYPRTILIQTASLVGINGDDKGINGLIDVRARKRVNQLENKLYCSFD